MSFIFAEKKIYKHKKIKMKLFKCTERMLRVHRAQKVVYELKNGIWNKTNPFKARFVGKKIIVGGKNNFLYYIFVTFVITLLFELNKQSTIICLI